MRIRMLREITGPRWDGQEWPLRGGELDVPDEEGAALCGQGDAVPVTADGTETPEKPDAATETRGTAESHGEGSADAGAGDSKDAAGKPAQNAPKAAWVDHAASQGFDRGVAESMTKADLTARFG